MIPFKGFPPSLVPRLVESLTPALDRGCLIAAAVLFML